MANKNVAMHSSSSASDTASAGSASGYASNQRGSKRVQHATIFAGNGNLEDLRNRLSNYAKMPEPNPDPSKIPNSQQDKFQNRFGNWPTILPSSVKQVKDKSTIAKYSKDLYEQKLKPLSSMKSLHKIRTVLIRGAFHIKPDLFNEVSDKRVKQVKKLIDDVNLGKSDCICKAISSGMEPCEVMQVLKMHLKDKFPNGIIPIAELVNICEECQNSGIGRKTPWHWVNFCSEISQKFKPENIYALAELMFITLKIAFENDSINDWKSVVYEMAQILIDIDIKRSVDSSDSLQVITEFWSREVPAVYNGKKTTLPFHRIAAAEFLWGLILTNYQVYLSLLPT